MPDRDGQLRGDNSKEAGFYISCIEEIAYRKGFIDKEQLIKLAQPMINTEYGKYLMEIVENGSL
jgi:glucose-1-phosphate thymidylyltransferase